MSKLYESKTAAEGYNSARYLPEQSIDLFLNVLTKNTSVNRISTVLDLGGGTGRFAPHLQRLYQCPVIVLDPSLEMVVQGSMQNYPGLHWGVAAAEYIPIKDASFDMVYMAQVYHHLEDKTKAFNEIGRVLKPGGYLVMRNGIQEDDDGMLHNQFFPEAVELDKDRIPDRESLIQDVISNGFNLITWRTGRQMGSSSHQEYYEKISHRGLSVLLAISDAAFSAGLKRMKDWVDSQPPDLPVYESITHFFFRKD